MLEAIRKSFNEIPMDTIKKTIKVGWRKRLKECIKMDGDQGPMSLGYA